ASFRSAVSKPSANQLYMSVTIAGVPCSGRTTTVVLPITGGRPRSPFRLEHDLAGGRVIWYRQVLVPDEPSAIHLLEHLGEAATFVMRAVFIFIFKRERIVRNSKVAATRDCDFFHCAVNLGCAVEKVPIEFTQRVDAVQLEWSRIFIEDHVLIIDIVRHDFVQILFVESRKLVSVQRYDFVSVAFTRSESPGCDDGPQCSKGNQGCGHSNCWFRFHLPSIFSVTRREPQAIRKSANRSRTSRDRHLHIGVRTIRRRLLAKAMLVLSPFRLSHAEVLGAAAWR